ncbi:hypothetical protein CNY89_01205 [Amaricoccus sp. HAR-UPW-R2A-40]|nr:hypothetical protein CNY89_01205 [Amaricoccus sp. HAR-UPW-R2A-40]
MLQALGIRDIVLIEAAELRFRPGLNVLTGETGAGKSILLDALGFALGWRGRPILNCGSEIISFHWVIQPTVRASAKIGVNSETGKPMASRMMPE